MIIKKRSINEIPLTDLWNENGVISEERLTYLIDEEIRNLLKKGKVQFVVANVGCPLEWIPIDNCFDFYKTKLKNRIADKEVNYLDNFPDNYFFYASEWKSNNLLPIVSLEMYH